MGYKAFSVLSPYGTDMLPENQMSNGSKTS
jgi:hypothetical protein